MSELPPQPGIIIRRSEAKGADLVLQVLTKEQGKIALLARGARGNSKRFSGGLDVFDCGVFSFSPLKGSSSLLLLKELESRHIWLQLRENLVCFSLASMAIECSNIFAREGDPDASRLFNPLFLCLKNLNTVDTDSKRFVCIIFYLVQLLKFSGFDLLSSPSLEGTVEKRWFQEMEERKVAFVPESVELIHDAMILLLENIQTIDGWELRTQENILLSLRRYLADNRKDKAV